jgi:hypothetical protein
MRLRIGGKTMRKTILFLITMGLTLLIVSGWFAVSAYRLLAVSLLEQEEEIGWESKRVERTFVVDDAPSLVVENFAGSVSVRAGESGVIRRVSLAVATRPGSMSCLEGVTSI